MLANIQWLENVRGREGEGQLMLTIMLKFQVKARGKKVINILTIDVEAMKFILQKISLFSDHDYTNTNRLN